MDSAVLQTCSFNERHTDANIANYLPSSDKVIACVHDNMINMVLVNRGLWESVPCFAHTLQLAINEGFGVASVKSGTFSPQHSGYSGKYPNTNLSRNSVCDMFARLFEQRWTVSAVLSDHNLTKLADVKTLALKDEHWQIVEELTPVLQSLKCATTAMCSETHVCVSLVYPIIHSLITKQPVSFLFRGHLNHQIQSVSRSDGHCSPPDPVRTQPRRWIST
ncbi:hypothetical protein M9458_052057 [Cirrhinus mrigala]|uniref:Uncharacterized protein n=1 Tax=Cirrhinus mrigala TaxID=683832 RepID=A0ABD0MTI0_CIRMR